VLPIEGAENFEEPFAQLSGHLGGGDGADQARCARSAGRQPGGGASTG
jgi:hypothetical protein